jgi:mRNA-degrading endonuclease HigB of HigAB toxin-antitoxin module
MRIRGFVELSDRVKQLPCTAIEALEQLRIRLKRHSFNGGGDVKRLEPGSQEVGAEILFPFQGREYYLVTTINYRIGTIKAYKIIHKNSLGQEYPQVMIFD